MSESDKNEVFLSPAPHIVTPVTTQKLMGHVLIALLPITVYGIYLYAWSAALRIAVSIVTAVVSEAAFRKAAGKDVRIRDLSAVVTGLLFALVIPPQLPVWVVIVSTAFSIIVAKECFGGLGANPFNPALTGRAFAFVSFPQLMTAWVQPLSVDAVSTATPLQYIKAAETPKAVFAAAASIAEKMQCSTPVDVYKVLFFGNYAGCIGETSALLILCGFFYLLIMKVITWHIPVIMTVTVSGIALLAGNDPLLAALSGGLLFGAVFMATDYATSPVTVWGQVLFAAGCGLITALLRLFAGIPEGVMFSILVMNAVVPFLNRIIPRKYGFVSASKAPVPGGGKK